MSKSEQLRHVNELVYEIISQGIDDMGEVEAKKLSSLELVEQAIKNVNSFIQTGKSARRFKNG